MKAIKKDLSLFRQVFFWVDANKVEASQSFILTKLTCAFAAIAPRSQPSLGL